jgi:hypothetical protein
MTNDIIITSKLVPKDRRLAVTANRFGAHHYH